MEIIVSFLISVLVVIAFFKFIKVVIKVALVLAALLLAANFFLLPRMGVEPVGKKLLNELSGSILK